MSEKCLRKKREKQYEPPLPDEINSMCRSSEGHNDYDNAILSLLNLSEFIVFTDFSCIRVVNYMLQVYIEN